MKRAALYVTTAVITMTGTFSITSLAAGRGGSCFNQPSTCAGQNGSCFGQYDLFTGGSNTCLSQDSLNSLLSGLLFGGNNGNCGNSGYFGNSGNCGNNGTYGNSGNQSSTCPSLVMPGQLWPNELCTGEDCYNTSCPDHYFSVGSSCGSGNLLWTDQSDINWPWQDWQGQNQPSQTQPDYNQPVQTLPGQNQNQSGSSTVSAYIEQVINLVNQERAKAGLSPVKESALVSDAASVRAQEIVRNFAHTRPNGSHFSTALRQSGVSFISAGENIAYGQRSPQEVMNVWMNSQSHRENILNNQYTNIGVGCYENNGTLYWVQLFTY